MLKRGKFIEKQKLMLDKLKPRFDDVRTHLHPPPRPGTTGLESCSPSSIKS